jgi:hypothetical protein
MTGNTARLSWTQRRQVERAIARLMQKDGDRCSLCHAGFTNNSVTYGGIGRDDRPALVGDCCMDKLRWIMTCGLYFAPHCEIAADLARKAGLSTVGIVSAGVSPLSCDDRKWFAANPQRSHRLRPAFPGELAASRVSIPMPSGHEVQYLVRQVEPGKRIRLPFCRDIACPIPGIEPIVHALFDIYSQGPAGAPPRVVSVAEVAQLARKYAAATRPQS